MQINQKGNATVIGIGVIIIVILLTGGFFLFKSNQTPSTEVIQTYSPSPYSSITSKGSTPSAATTITTSSSTTPSPTPKPFEFKNNTYINNQKGFSFQYSPTLIPATSVTTNDFVQLLENQAGSGNVARLTVEILDNPSNKSLDQIVTDRGTLKNDTYGLEKRPFTISGHNALSIEKQLTEAEICNNNGGTSKMRVFYVLVQGNGYVVQFNVNNSCESFTRDWFDITPKTFTFLKP